MIEVKNLTRSYGDNLAVDNISFRIEEGHVYGFLGPNGAGKSTTMNMITGCLAATSGTVTVGGFDIVKHPMKAKKLIGYLPEIPPLYPDLTVKEYLNFVANAKKISKKDRKEAVLGVMQKTGIPDVADRLIKNLSKGYRQRVGIAQAILGDPKIIILDEPTVGLDPSQIIEIRTLIKSLKENHTVILSSHILSEIIEICDEILIINSGKIVAFDTAENLSDGFNSGVVFEVTIKADAETAANALAAVEQITRIEVDDTDESGVTKLFVFSDSGEGLRETIAEVLMKNSILTLSINESKADLEDIYLNVTSGDYVPAQEDEDGNDPDDITVSAEDDSENEEEEKEAEEQ